MAERAAGGWGPAAPVGWAALGVAALTLAAGWAAGPWAALAVAAGAGAGFVAGRSWARGEEGGAPPEVAPAPSPTAASAVEVSLALAAAELRERRRVAALLHDEVQPGLAGLRLALHGGLTPAEADGVLAELIGRTRDLARSFAASADAGALRAGLVAVVAHFERWHRADVRLAPGPPVDCDPEISVVALSIVRELLFNACAHAGGSVVVVELEQSDAWVVLRVRDHGEGFRMTEVMGGGGTRLVDWRAEAVGGQVDRWSAPGEGTRVTLCLPLRAPPPAPGRGLGPARVG
jgi:signal transduction histidine kinase